MFSKPKVKKRFEKPTILCCYYIINKTNLVLFSSSSIIVKLGALPVRFAHTPSTVHILGCVMKEGSNLKSDKNIVLVSYHVSLPPLV